MLRGRSPPRGECCPQGVVQHAGRTVVFTSMSGKLALGIFDQGVWLRSRLKDPFVTIRGLPLFGDHASSILVLVAPLYWLWPDPRLLLRLQLSAWPAFQWIDMTGLRAGRYRLCATADPANWLVVPAAA